MNYIPASTASSYCCNGGRSSANPGVLNIAATLAANIGKVVTCYTSSSDHRGEDGFTGIVTSVNSGAAYLVTSSGNGCHCYGEPRPGGGCFYSERRDCRPMRLCDPCARQPCYLAYQDRRDTLCRAVDTSLVIALSDITAVAVHND